MQDSAQAVRKGPKKIKLQMLGKEFAPATLRESQY